MAKIHIPRLAWAIIAFFVCLFALAYAATYVWPAIGNTIATWLKSLHE
jgi:phosphotransferase system  glucose/maltose/N-acetylglucosamine-specific IIC component